MVLYSVAASCPYQKPGPVEGTMECRYMYLDNRIKFSEMEIIIIIKSGYRNGEKWNKPGTRGRSRSYDALDSL